MSGAAIRQMRSNHHQRHYSSEHLIFDPSAIMPTSAGAGGHASAAASGRWYSSSSQQVEYSRMTRGSDNRGFVTESWEPGTPMQTNNNTSIIEDEFSANELSPGLLDLHSFDTDLLPNMNASGDDSSVGLNYERDQMVDESEPTISSSKQTGKSLSTDKDKANSVAKIRVVVRKRPLNKKEIAKKEEDIISIRTNSLVVHETKLKVDLTEYMEKHEFVFDAVLDEDVSNDEVYRETVEPIIPAIFQRTKATCFAYGQTGSGKTYTMQPLPLKASEHIFRLMHYTYRNQGFHLFVSFFEIYGGKLFDLLGEKKKLCMREDGKQQVCIVGLQEFKVLNVDTIRELIEKGNASRSTGMTGANEESSRSHAILQLVIKKTIEGKESKPPKVVGKLSFIDLAGSERGADTYDNDKQTRIEGAEINKSLLALKECIRALDNDQVHIPFRGSKLTEVLRDSFIGNSKTVMISCISPNSSSCEHTLNTLRYADRVKSLSKGASKKDLLSSSSASNLRDPSPTPVKIIDYTSCDTPSESRKVWSKQIDRDSTVPTSNTESRTPLSSTTRGTTPRRGNGYGYSEELNANQHDRRILSKKGSMNGHTALPPNMDGARIRGESPLKWKDVKSNEMEANDDLGSLLKEEEELVMTHREQVEETINILREEMKLLEEADQPGNQLDEYISRLNVILSKKAAGIMNLQARLANFQRRLSDNNVLVTPLGL